MTVSDRAAAGGAEGSAAFLAGEMRDALGLKSSDLQIGLTIAKGHMDRGAYSDALSIYAPLVLLEPATIDFQIGLANCALQMERFELALQTASVAVALAPRDPRGYFISGKSCLALGLHQEAREDLDDAVKFGIEARNAGLVESARKLLSALPSAQSAAPAGR